jgi:CheY-like chemotaxis protein
MSEPIRVAILGFSVFERTAMASYFNLGARRTPGYQCVLDVDSAHYIVADADQPGVVALLRTLGRTSDAVFVGAHGPAEAAAWMMRPINPVHVLRELDTLLTRRRSMEEGGGTSTSPGALLTLPDALGGRDLRAAEPGRRAGDDADAESVARSLRRSQAETRRRNRAEALRPQVLRRALLVDDSEIALHFLRRHLELYGLDCDLARHSNRALDLLTHHPYGFVFVDVDLGEDSASDGLTLCQTIKQRLVVPGGRPPMVIIVSAFHSAVDQVRGTLAGADGYIGKPLEFGALDRLLQAQGLSRLTSGTGLGVISGRAAADEPRP